MEDTLEHLADSVDVVFGFRSLTENEAESFENQQGLVSFQVSFGNDLESFESLHDLSKAIGNDFDADVGLVIKEDESGSKLELCFEPRAPIEEPLNVEKYLTATATIEKPLGTECTKMGSFQSKDKKGESSDPDRKAADSVPDSCRAQTGESSEESQQVETETAQLNTPYDSIDQETCNDTEVGDERFDNAVTGGDKTTSRAFRHRRKPRVHYSPDRDAQKVSRKPKKVVPRPGNRKPAVKVKLEAKPSGSSGLICCPHCPREFVTYIEYNRHVSRTHLEASMCPTYGCSTCGKKFKTEHYLQTHKRTHTGERPYGCPHCPRNFSQSGNLQTHIRHIHTGERPYGCTVCGKRFLQKSNLDQHFRLHTGVRPYGCDRCGMRFTQGSGLYYHKNSCN